jgi:SAM-dependent methyltransferase
MIGIDEDPAAFAAARHRLSEKGLDAPLIRADFLAGMQETPHGLAAVLCLGNTFMCVADVRVAAALLREIHRALAPGGLFVIDDFPFECWREIADGNWQEGVSEDGTQQIVFVPGDAAIALRQGGGVDPKNWNIRAGERLLRLWSMGDLELLALTAGMSRPRRLERAGVICFTRSPAPGQ